MRVVIAVLPRLLTLALLLLFMGVPAPVQAEERFALLVGANAGWANDRPLRDAEQDAERLRDVLVELGGFTPDRVMLLRDPDTATVRASLRRLSERLRTAAGASLVFVYFAGHQDERGLHLRGRPLSREELQEAVAALPAEARLGVLDVCLPKDPASRAGQHLGLVVFQGHGETCGARQALKGQTFSQHLVTGLRGGADEDGNGQVRLSEAARYALRQVQPEEDPGAALPGWGEQEPFLAHPGQGEAGLRLSGDAARYVVVDSRVERPVADVRAEAGRDVLLALAAGPYVVLRVRAAQVERALLLLEPAGRPEAATLAYEDVREGCMPRCGSQGLEGEALRAWRRNEAMALLTSGEPGTALVLLDALLEEQPDDEASRRGKARALVWLADSYARSGQESLDQEALRAALEAEPTLTEDPDFSQRLQRFRRREAVEHRTTQLEVLKQPEDSDSPYDNYRWALGLEVLGSRGLLAPLVLWLPSSSTQFHLALDPLGAQAVDIGGRVQVVDLYAGLDVFVGLGVHQQLWSKEREPMARFWSNAHLDFSMQVFISGLLREAGVYLRTEGLVIEFGISAHVPIKQQPTVQDVSGIGSLGVLYFLP
jgi:hypothetical protein